MTTDAEPTTEKPTFEDSVRQLQEIVHDLESGSLGLEESLAEFEKATKLLRSCYGSLEQAEQKIELLTRLTDEGEVTTEPFDGEASVEKSSTARRSRKKKTTSKPRAKKSKTVAEKVAEPEEPAKPPTANPDQDDEVPPDADVRSLFD